jgi:hypothetical protein
LVVESAAPSKLATAVLVHYPRDELVVRQLDSRPDVSNRNSITNDAVVATALIVAAHE